MDYNQAIKRGSHKSLRVNICYQFVNMQHKYNLSLTKIFRVLTFLDKTHRNKKMNIPWKALLTVKR